MYVYYVYNICNLLYYIIKLFMAVNYVSVNVENPLCNNVKVIWSNFKKTLKIERNHIYYMTMDDNTYYPMAIKIVLARLWDNTFICVIT